MKVILDDTLIKNKLYPFTQTRHVADIRIGILTIREKWEKILGKNVSTELLNFSGKVSQPDEVEMPVIMSADIVPTQHWVEDLLKGNNSKNIFEPDGDIKIIRGPADIFAFNDWAIRKDFELITSGRRSQPISSSNKVTSPENIFIEEGAKMEHCILNASTGPIYIGRNAEMMDGCIVRGPLAMCEGSVLKMGAKVYGAVTLGPYSIAGGEIKNSVLFGYSNKAHDGYLGDSVIGEWCNLGAGTTNSNVKNTAGDVLLWDNAAQQYINAGLKCGLIMGDYSRAAINTSFNTGTVVGTSCNIFTPGFPPKFVPDFSWGDERYELDKVIKDIENWKRLKGKIVTDEEKEMIKNLYNQS